MKYTFIPINIIIIPQNKYRGGGLKRKSTVNVKY